MRVAVSEEREERDGRGSEESGGGERVYPAPMDRTARRALLTLATSGLLAARLVGCTGELSTPPANEDSGLPAYDSSLPPIDAPASPFDGGAPGPDATLPADAGPDATAPGDASDAAFADAADAAPPIDAADGAPGDAAPTDSASEGAANDAGADAGLDAALDTGAPDATPDASACSGAGCPPSCAAILAADAGAADGTYVIDPGTGPIPVACLMSVNGGGWTPLVPPVASALDTVTSKAYLYVYGSAWYESPPSTLAWSWSSGQQLTGQYAYFDGTTASSYSCAGSGEVPAFGVGCSNGPGGNLKTLPYYSEDAPNAKCEVCQDQPNAFGTGACALGVAVYVR